MKLIAFLCGCLISAPLCAYERKDANTVILTDDEAQICSGDGDCVLAPRAMLIAALQRAHDAGLHECRNAT